MKLDTSREDFASSHIPFSSPLTNNIVATRDGDYISTWFINGLSFEGLSEQESLAKMDALNILVRSISNGKYAVWVHRIRRNMQDSLTLPESGFKRDLVSKYQDKLANGGLLTTELYLTIVHRPFPQKYGKNLQRIFSNARTDAKLLNRQVIEIFANLDSQVRSTLEMYGVNQLSTYEENGKTFSRQLEFYAYLLNGHWWKVPYKNLQLNKFLPVTRHHFGNELVMSTDTYGTKYSAFVDLKDYAEFTEPGLLNTLLGLPCEYVETHSFSPLTTPDSISAIKLQRGRLQTGGDDAISQIQALDVAMDDLQSGRISFGEYHYTMQVKGSTAEAVRQARSDAIEELQKKSFLAVPVDGIVDHAFWSQLPGNWSNRPRVANLSSRNFTGLCSFHNFSSGKRNNNPWGEAITILKTAADQPYYLNFHSTPNHENSFGEKALGNVQIIGKSGTGKTVLALFTAACMAKYGVTVVWFDKDRGAEIGLRAMGANYLSLQKGQPTGLAPFKLEPTDENVLFWVDLIRRCTLDPSRPHTPEDKADITKAVKAVATLPKEIRGFEAIMQSLPQVDQNGVAARLKEWCSGDRLGWALDNVEDSIDLSSSMMTGFDYTEILNDDSTRSPIMMYLMFRVENMIDGRKFAYYMDEYWEAIGDQVFEDFAKNKQKTIRKQNGLGVFMTHSPSDALSSPIAKALIEQTATYIYLPNPAADRADYMDGFKLTETEYDLVRTLPENSRYFLIKQGSNVSVATLDLKGLKDELKLLSGSLDNVEKLDKIRAVYGDNPDAWMAPFLER